MHKKVQVIWEKFYVMNTKDYVEYVSSVCNKVALNLLGILQKKLLI